MTTSDERGRDITARSAYQLAHDSGTACPDALDSPGALFLLRVARDTVDRYCPDDDRNDTLHEIADAAVPVYTFDRWRTFVDVAAYVEDLEALVPDSADLTTVAGIALYVVAERVAATVWDELAGTDGAAC